MNKFPHVEYDPVGGGVRGESAIEIYKFLADEAEFDGDVVKGALFKARAKQLSVVPPASVGDEDLKEAIAKWGKKSDR
tara:strand:- start:184 stop:417 length:234 start_codon:yes stop_codon:yes gene_type:complete